MAQPQGKICTLAGRAILVSLDLSKCPNCLRGDGDCLCSWEVIAAAYERHGYPNEARVTRELGAQASGGVSVPHTPGDETS